MNGQQTHLIWSAWLLQQCLEWGAALGLFFLVPWAHYQSSVAPRLEQIETLRTQLDQEMRRLQKQNWERDWEVWAGKAMVQVQAAVQTTRERLEGHEPAYDLVLTGLMPDRTHSTTITAPIDPEKISKKTPPVSDPPGTSQSQPVASRYVPLHTPVEDKNDTTKAAGLKHGVLLHLPHTGPEDILWTAVNEFYGVPYRFGGQDRFGMDCSALIQAVFARLHIDLPRTAQTQFDSRLGVYIGLDDLQPGDLVFFHTRPTPYVSHVGIYLGENEFLHAPRSGRRVEITALNEFYRSRFIAAKRLLADPFFNYKEGKI
jgi:cell wall-associated NlpC family hydrolase